MCNFYKQGIAIATAKDDAIHNQVLIAQAADTLLDNGWCCQLHL